jgi:hypothetical protein
MIVAYVQPDGSTRPAQVLRQHGVVTGYHCADLTVSMPDGSTLRLETVYHDATPRPGSWHKPAKPLAWPVAPRQRRKA